MVGAGRGRTGATGLGAAATGLGATGLGAGAFGAAGLGAAAFGLAALRAFAFFGAAFLALLFLATARFFVLRAGAAFFAFLAVLALDFFVFDFAFFAMIVLPIVSAQISQRLERTAVWTEALVPPFLTLQTRTTTMHRVIAVVQLAPPAPRARARQ
jgi:hypothetical protein